MNPNSNAAPHAPLEPPADVVDRTQRDELAALVRSFLDEKMTAFAFDERLERFRDSADSVVQLVVTAVWFHYDDCTDHLVALSKPEWDYFQRLLLLLESDCRVHAHSARRWSFSQLIALCSLLGFLWVAFQVGWGRHLLVVGMPFGIVSIGISKWRSGVAARGPYDQTTFPFTNFADLKSAYNSVAFKKVRCPQRLQVRRVRSPLMSGVIQLQFYVVWLILSPFALFLQVLPPRETHARIVAA